MEDFKILVKLSMKLLNEAEHYADCYRDTDDSAMKSLYYNLANGHMDLYNKVRIQIASEVNDLVREKPNEHADTIWMFLKTTEDELKDKIMTKMK